MKYQKHICIYILMIQNRTELGLIVASFEFLLELAILWSSGWILKPDLYVMSQIDCNSKPRHDFVYYIKREIHLNKNSTNNLVTTWNLDILLLLYDIKVPQW